MQSQIQGMKGISLSTNLLVQVQGFMSKKKAQLCEELGEKYSVPPDEVADVVDTFLMDTYGPAKRLAELIAEKDETMLLFIGKKDCNVCKRCKPILEGFLTRHKELKVAKLDYSQPEGLLYHMIHNQDYGQLPLIAFIFEGRIKMVFTGECVCVSVYEKCYSDILAESSQNIYAH
jgi:hypothetical protein